MEMKQLINLKESDLLNRPVWEHWTEGNIEYVKPTYKKEIYESGTKGFIVLTSFTLKNGTSLNGFCSPQDSSGLDYIQPVIFSENEQVALWRDGGWTTADQNNELKKLGLAKEEIFPIVFRTMVKCEEEFYQNTIEDFNKKK
ncbi:MAG: hypothetical protein ABJ092_13025 [Gillisia sp.]